MLLKIKKIAIGLSLFFSVGVMADQYFIQADVPGVVETVVSVPDNRVYTSCQELKLAHPEYVSGSYTITPTGNAAMSLYCDMETDGGGWTIVAKQSNFERSNFRLFDLNVSTLADLSFNGTSPGGIQKLFTHNQVMLLNGISDYLIFNNTFSGLSKTPCSGNSSNSCALISKTVIKRMGLLSIPSSATLTFTYIQPSDFYSGIIIGTANSNPWCSVISGRYNGGCRDGNYGIGNWAVFVR